MNRYRKAGGAEQVASEMRAEGGRAPAVQADVSDADVGGAPFRAAR